MQLTPASKDGGYDIFAISKDITGLRSSWIVECKKYREGRPVGVDFARSLYAVKSDLKVSNALLATTSYFTKGVHAFKSSRYNFGLADYEKLIGWINNYRPHPDGKLHISEEGLVLP